MVQRNDELTLAGLRPGQDDVGKAQRLFQKPSVTKFDGTNHIWQDPCRHQSLSIIADASSGTILEVRVAENNSKFDSGAGASPGQTNQDYFAASKWWFHQYYRYTINITNGTTPLLWDPWIAND